MANYTVPPENFSQVNRGRPEENDDGETVISIAPGDNKASTEIGDVSKALSRLDERDNDVRQEDDSDETVFRKVCEEEIPDLTDSLEQHYHSLLDDQKNELPNELSHLLRDEVTGQDEIDEIEEYAGEVFEDIKSTNYLRDEGLSLMNEASLVVNGDFTETGAEVVNQTYELDGHTAMEGRDARSFLNNADRIVDYEEDCT